MRIVESLVAANAALVADDRSTALAKLLDAWRTLRHPRIANLIDYVSDALLANAAQAAALKAAWLADPDEAR